MKHLFFLVLFLTACSPVDMNITSFQGCKDAGNPIMESYPEQCQVDGKTFIRDIGNTLEKTDLIRLHSPLPGEKISADITLNGEARGYWFFEATFPVVLTDDDGNVLAQTYATASEDWMTEDFVPFTAQLSVPTVSVPTGKLILKHSNASGLPERDDALIIPVTFS